MAHHSIYSSFISLADLFASSFFVFLFICLIITKKLFKNSTPLMMADKNNNNIIKDKDDTDRLPQTNDVIKGESGNLYRLVQVLGEGGYGTVFKAIEEKTDRVVALKAEKWSKTVLRIELYVLQAINLARTPKHFCQLIDYGKQSREYMFIVMSFLGPDLHRIRNEQIDRKFTLPTAVRVGIQTISAIQELHDVGFLSRDIKPGNFAVGNREEDRHRSIYMFDFGLARKYVDRNGNVLPARKDPGWRGTTRYGSLQAHFRQDLSRKDDIESWFYALVELTKGCVPWRMLVDRPKVLESKIYARGEGRKDFLANCPKCYDQILSMIDGLSFESEPQYSKMITLLETYCTENNVTMEQKYDWEEVGSLSLKVKPADKAPYENVRDANAPGERRSARSMLENKSMY